VVHIWLRLRRLAAVQLPKLNLRERRQPDEHHAAERWPWTFSLSTSATLIVTDAFVPGDQFRLFDNGSVLGDTSLPVNDVFGSCDNNISACLADPEISKGEFVLAAGAHALSGTVVQSPFDGGVGYFEVSTIPEPATAALLGIVLPVLWIARRRDRRAGAPLLID
jgi:hypothetical protein